MRRLVLIALLCAGVASCMQFGVEPPHLRPALLVNHMQHLTLSAEDGEDVLRIELGFDSIHPSWCPRFTLDVTVNGDPAELVEEAHARSRGDGCGSSNFDFECVLPSFDYHFDPSDPPEALRIEVSDRSMTLVAEAETPAEVARVELDRDVVMPGDVAHARLVPEPSETSDVWISVQAEEARGAQEISWARGELPIQIPKEAGPGKGEVTVFIEDWIPLAVSCEDFLVCWLQLDHIARGRERQHATAIFTIEQASSLGD